MLIDGTNLRFRQSWLDTVMRCPERGRLAIVHPEMDGEGDAAFAGTSFHAACEEFLGGRLEWDDMVEFAREYAWRGTRDGIMKDGVNRKVQFKSFSDVDELVYHAGNCVSGWQKDIYPELVRLDMVDGDQEVEFQFAAFVYRGHTIWLQGTVDHIPSRGNMIWDWKSSGSDYRQKEKQSKAIQPTAYAAAAINGEFGREFVLPLEFSYGVAIRLKTKARGQVVTVERRQAHIDFMYRRIRHYVDLYLDLGLDREWPMNEDHFLCSAKWCPWYEGCRGSHVTRDMDLFGYSG